MKTLSRAVLAVLFVCSGYFVALPVAQADEALANGDRRPSRGGFDLDWDEEDEPRSGKFAGQQKQSSPVPQATPVKQQKRIVNDFQRDTNILRENKSAQNFDDFFNQDIEDSSRREDLFVAP